MELLQQATEEAEFRIAVAAAEMVADEDHRVEWID